MMGPGVTTAPAVTTAAGHDDPVVQSVTAAVYQVPTDQPEADGTLAWSSTTMVIAQVCGGGRTGLGYTYGSAACQPLIEGTLAGAVTGRGVFDTGASLEAMVRAVRNMGRPGIASYAISAVETALWDLKGILLGVPVCALLGAVRDTVPVYGSGGFTTYDEPAARTQLERWTHDLGIPRVKIKIGESWGTAEAATWPGSSSPARSSARTRNSTWTPTAATPASRRSGWAARWLRPASAGSRSRSAPTTSTACARCATRLTRTSRRGSTATTCPTSAAWCMPGRSTASRWT